MERRAHRETKQYAVVRIGVGAVADDVDGVEDCGLGATEEAADLEVCKGGGLADAPDGDVAWPGDLLCAGGGPEQGVCDSELGGDVFDDGSGAPDLFALSDTARDGQRVEFGRGGMWDFAVGDFAPEDGAAEGDERDGVEPVFAELAPDHGVVAHDGAALLDVGSHGVVWGCHLREARWAFGSLWEAGRML